jgi:hypothetical protein
MIMAVVAVVLAVVLVLVAVIPMENMLGFMRGGLVDGVVLVGIKNCR